MAFLQISETLAELLVDNSNNNNTEIIEEWSDVRHMGLVAPEYIAFLLLLTAIAAVHRGVEIGHPIYAVVFTNLVVPFIGTVITIVCFEIIPDKKDYARVVNLVNMLSLLFHCVQWVIVSGLRYVYIVRKDWLHDKFSNSSKIRKIALISVFVFYGIFIAFYCLASKAIIGPSDNWPRKSTVEAIPRQDLLYLALFTFLCFAFLIGISCIFYCLILLQDKRYFKDKGNQKGPNDGVSQNDCTGGVFIGLSGQSVLEDNDELRPTSGDPGGRKSKLDLRSLASDHAVQADPDSETTKTAQKCTLDDYVAEEAHIPTGQADQPNLSNTRKDLECSLHVRGENDEVPSSLNFPDHSSIKRRIPDPGYQGSMSDLGTDITTRLNRPKSCKESIQSECSKVYATLLTKNIPQQSTDSGQVAQDKTSGLDSIDVSARQADQQSASEVLIAPQTVIRVSNITTSAVNIPQLNTDKRLSDPGYQGSISDVEIDVPARPTVWPKSCEARMDRDCPIVDALPSVYNSVSILIERSRFDSGYPDSASDLYGNDDPIRPTRRNKLGKNKVCPEVSLDIGCIHEATQSASSLPLQFSNIKYFDHGLQLSSSGLDPTDVPAEQSDRPSSSKFRAGRESSLHVTNDPSVTPSIGHFHVQYINKKNSQHGSEDSGSDFDRIDVLSARMLHQKDLACLPEHALGPSSETATMSDEEYEAAKRSLITNLILIMAFILSYLFLAFLSKTSQAYYRVILFSIQKCAMPLMTSVKNFVIIKNVVVFYGKLIAKRVLNSLGRDLE